MGDIYVTGKTFPPRPRLKPWSPGSDSSTLPTSLKKPACTARPYRPCYLYYKIFSDWLHTCMIKLKKDMFKQVIITNPTCKQTEIKVKTNTKYAYQEN